MIQPLLFQTPMKYQILSDSKHDVIDGMTSSCCTFEARSQRAPRKIIWIALIRISLPTMRLSVVTDLSYTLINF